MKLLHYGSKYRLSKYVYILFIKCLKTTCLLHPLCFSHHIVNRLPSCPIFDKRKYITILCTCYMIDYKKYYELWSLLELIRFPFHVFRFINIESSSSNDDIEEDEYLRDGTDYGNITHTQDENTEDVPGDQVMETVYFMESKTDELPDNPEPDLNTTIIPGIEMEPSSSIWEGIMGLVEDLDGDSKLADVSCHTFLNCNFCVL